MSSRCVPGAGNLAESFSASVREASRSPSTGPHDVSRGPHCRPRLGWEDTVPLLEADIGDDAGDAVVGIGVKEGLGFGLVGSFVDEEGA